MRRPDDVAQDLIVTLASGDTTEATVPPSVTILAGQTSATFDSLSPNIGTSYWASVLRVGHAYWFVGRDSTGAVVADLRLRSVLCIPIRVHGEIGGVHLVRPGNDIQHQSFAGRPVLASEFFHPRTAVPKGEDKANDEVYCLDAETGDKVWKKTWPGNPGDLSSTSGDHA